jgi:hypothetical protein
MSAFTKQTKRWGVTVGFAHETSDPQNVLT